MAFNAKDARSRLQAAHALLLEPSTTREKFNSVRDLVRDINPQLDQALARIEQHLSTWDKIESGDVIHLTADHLPENTEEEKKRKKWLLLFINGWKQLKSEVARVQAEFEASQSSNTPSDTGSLLGRILWKAKGPLGLVTVIAVGVVALQQAAVAITIQNKGCGTMHPSSSIPISIPGLSLPNEPIASGGSAVATLPGLTVHVDGTDTSALSIKVLSYSLTFQLPSNIDNVTMDGASLLGKKTTVKLSEKDAHTLVLTCS
ncbi:hypothetical protein HY969_04770 [Candidatus Kaiserbacteria bacterium]|nr:hypothetical protein [Candidatus Kaiserbacteria bacterium]